MAPKKAVKAKKTAKKTTKVAEKPKRKRLFLSLCVPASELSKEAIKAIETLDKLEVQIADLTDSFQAALSDAVQKIGGSSFEHPTRGQMSIMQRGDKWFWRSKPAGQGQATEKK